MKTTRRIIALIALILIMSATPGVAKEIGPQVSIHGATSEEAALIDWALGRFAVGDLPLPHLTFRFHATIEACKGFIGYYTSASNTVDVCNRGDRKVEQRHTLIHEMAHAWQHHYLSEEQMTAWTERRGLESWKSRDFAWWQRGQEQAAEIVAWGLVDEPILVEWVRFESCDDLAADFEALTGRAPLNDFTDSCRQDDGHGNGHDSGPTSPHQH